MFAAGGVAEDNKFTNTYQCTARANMPDYKFQTEDPAVKPPAFTGVCGVGGPYGVGGNVTRSPGVTVEEACKYGGLIPWVNQDTYINDFDSGTVQEISRLFSTISYCDCHQKAPGSHTCPTSYYQPLPDQIYCTHRWANSHRLCRRLLQGWRL